MAPEQFAGNKGKVSRQTDIHAFSVVLWEMLAGRPLFRGDNETEIVGNLIEHKVPSLSGMFPNLPPTVDAVIKQGLALTARDRYATAREMLVALQACGPSASTLDVADWLRGQMNDALVERSLIVRTMEADRDTSSTNALEGGDKLKAQLDQARSAYMKQEEGPSKDNLVKPEPTAASGERPVSSELEQAPGAPEKPLDDRKPIDSPTLEPPPEAQVSPAALPSVPLAVPGLRSWVRPAAVGVVLACLVAAGFLWKGRTAPRAAAPSTPPSAIAPPPASTPEIPAPAPVEPAPLATEAPVDAAAALPVGTVAQKAPPANTATPAPALHPARPPRPAPSSRKQRPESVFETRD